MISYKHSLPLRFYDFLAYLFPGIATLHAVCLIFGDPVRKQLSNLLTGNLVVDSTLGIIAAYIIGLFWSGVSRELFCRLLWSIVDPRVKYFKDNSINTSASNNFINEAIRQQATKLFGNGCVSSPKLYRLCCTFVANNMPSSRDRLGDLIAVRSMSANCIGPVLLYTVFFSIQSSWLLAIGTVLIAVSLGCKVARLDLRVCREVACAFIAWRSDEPK